MEATLPPIPGFESIAGDLRAVEALLQQNVASSIHLVPQVGQYVFNNGGKRFRPSLLLLSARLCGYYPVPGGGHRSVLLASVVELIHTATLLHDDVVDEAERRRGSASVNSVWGNKTSILMGDYLFSRAIALFMQDGDPKIMQILSETITKMVEGELLQMSWEGDDRLNEQDYLAVITGKTASLMGAACQMGAVLAAAPASWEGALARYGLEVGLAFQLVDDSLDYTATEEELGKARGADLQEGKITLPLLKTLRRCTSTERAALEAVILSTTPSGDGLAMVLDLIRRYGSLQETAEEARRHLRQAIEALAAFPASPDKEALISAATYVVERRR